MQNWEIQMILDDAGFYCCVDFDRAGLEVLSEVDAEVTEKIDLLKWHKKHGFVTAAADYEIHDLQRARRAIRRLIRARK